MSHTSPQQSNLQRKLLTQYNLIVYFVFTFPHLRNLDFIGLGMLITYLRALGFHIILIIKYSYTKKNETWLQRNKKNKRNVRLYQQSRSPRNSNIWFACCDLQDTGRRGGQFALHNIPQCVVYIQRRLMSYSLPKYYKIGKPFPPICKAYKTATKPAIRFSTFSFLSFLFPVVCVVVKVNLLKLIW